MVVYCEGGPTHGFWGEIITIAARSRGILGLITNGAVRDSDAIRGMNYPVFCGGVQIHGTIKERRGNVGDSVTLGNVTVATGDFVVADSDGIVLIHPEALDAVLGDATAREQKQARMMSALSEGKTTLTLLGLSDGQS